MDSLPEVVREAGLAPSSNLALIVALAALFVAGLAVYALIKTHSK